MKTYKSHEVVSILKTSEAFGGLSSTAPGYQIKLYGRWIKTSEHLYQALKFPDHPEIQAEILTAPSPIKAKRIARKLAYRPFIRPDWDEIKLPVMEYCLRAKLKCNFQRFGDLLRSTGNADIVQISPEKDTFWGCVPDGELLIGHNHFGDLLTTLRNELVREGADAGQRMMLSPPKGVALRLNGKPIGTLPFGVWNEEILVERFLSMLRAKHTIQECKATEGGF